MPGFAWRPRQSVRGLGAVHRPAQELTNVKTRLDMPDPICRTIGTQLRFIGQGIEGLRDEPRPGRPRTYDDDRVAALVDRALQEKPRNADAWSVRRMAAAEGVSKSTVHRWFTLHGIKPHRS